MSQSGFEYTCSEENIELLEQAVEFTKEYSSEEVIRKMLDEYTALMESITMKKAMDIYNSNFLELMGDFLKYRGAMIAINEFYSCIEISGRIPTPEELYIWAEKSFPNASKMNQEVESPTKETEDA